MPRRRPRGPSSTSARRGLHRPHPPELPRAAGIPAPHPRGSRVGALVPDGARRRSGRYWSCGPTAGSRQGLAMNRHTGSVPRVVTGGGPAFVALQRRPRWLPAISFALALCSAGQAAANVTQSGDVSPPFAPAPVVDLTGQRIFIGNTSGGVGGIGTVSVTAGGILTAAQIVPGTGGLGTGFVTVTGAGQHRRTSPAARSSNGLDIGSWGTGIVTVSSGGTDRLRVGGGVRVQHHRQRRRLDRNALHQRRLGHGARVDSRSGGEHRSGFGTPGANTAATLSISERRNPVVERQSAVAANSGQTGLVTGNVTISGAGSAWAISRDLAGGGRPGGPDPGAEQQHHRQHHAQQRRQSDHHRRPRESGHRQHAAVPQHVGHGRGDEPP